MNTTVITATPQAGDGVFATVTDTTTITRVVDLELEADEAKFGEPGEVVTYSHVLTNTGNYTDTYTIGTVNSPEWAVAAQASIEVPSWQSRTFVVSVTVPVRAISDTWEVLVITAKSVADGSKFETVQDTTTVTRVVGMGLEANEGKYAEPLEVVTYTHTLTNAGNYTDTYTIEARSGRGWT